MLEKSEIHFTHFLLEEMQISQRYLNNESHKLLNSSTLTDEVSTASVQNSIEFTNIYSTKYR